MILTIPLYFFNLYHVPLGILVGSIVSIIFYYLLAKFENKDKENAKMRIAMILQILRFIIVSGLLILFVFIEFKLKFKLFNPFGYLGGYMIPTIVLIIVGLKS